jgi:hypothetical protein
VLSRLLQGPAPTVRKKKSASAVTETEEGRSSCNRHTSTCRGEPSTPRSLSAAGIDKNLASRPNTRSVECYVSAKAILAECYNAINEAMTITYTNARRSPPDWCANRAALRSACGRTIVSDLPERNCFGIWTSASYGGAERNIAADVAVARAGPKRRVSDGKPAAPRRIPSTCSI